MYPDQLRGRWLRETLSSLAARGARGPVIEVIDTDSGALVKQLQVSSLKDG